MLKFQTQPRSLLLAILCVSCSYASARADSPAVEREKLQEPVYRVTDAGNKERGNPAPATVAKTPKATATNEAIPLPVAAPSASPSPPSPAVADAFNNRANRFPPHPKLAEAINDATITLNNIRENVADYECLLVRREKVNGTVMEPEYLNAKVRRRQVDANGNVTTPFTVYLKYLKPASVKGRQVIYDESKSKEKIYVKEGGFKGKFIPAVWIKMSHPLVMKTCRHPMTDIGFENLTVLLLERSTEDNGNKADRDYTVKYEKSGWNLNKIDCNYLRADFLTQRPCNDASRIEVFIDKNRQIPIRYVAYDWPSAKGAKPDILEEYTYLNVKLNTGLTNKDFDPSTYPGF